MEFTITSQEILGFCGLITALWGVYKIIKELNKPNDDLKKQVFKNTQELKNEDERLKEIEQTDKLILQSLLVIINHDITGNGIDKLKETRDELQEFLINK